MFYLHNQHRLVFFLGIKGLSGVYVVLPAISLYLYFTCYTKGLEYRLYWHMS